MEILCTRPNCANPKNFFSELGNSNLLKTSPQKYCITCGMPLILADRYLPEKLLGQGGFGAAFLARDRYSPTFRSCVVKQFKPAGNLGNQELEIARDLFAREGVVLEEIGNQHPQIPNLFAYFTPIVPAHNSTTAQATEQYFYLVQEYIDGNDLETELEKTGRFSEAEVQLILQEVLHILEFIHKKNVIHRDIKPSNIMRDRQGITYLLDFGAVKQIASGSKTSKSTGIYSMGFAPPEQVAGNQVYPATDLYALGVTCFSLLTDKPAEELYDTYNNRWLWQNQVKISDRLAQILDKMTMSAPSERFQSATEILSLLNNAQTSNKSPQPQHFSANAATSTSTSPNPALSKQKSTQPANKNQPFAKAATANRNPPQSPSPNIHIQNPPQFSLLEILGSAAFTGFEGGLLAIVLSNVLSSPGLSFGIVGAIVAGLVFAQTRRIIEKIDFLIIVAITTSLVYFLPVLQGGFTIGTILIIAAMSGATLVGVTALFRLIYAVLTKIL